MTLDELKNNIKHMREIIREIYIFTNQFNMIEDLEFHGEIIIDKKEKKLLNETIGSLKVQIKILNNSIPDLLENVGFYKKLPEKIKGESVVAKVPEKKQKLIQVKYNEPETKERVFLTISDKDKEEFLENLSKSNLSIRQLKKNFAIEKSTAINFGRPNIYAKISNRFFRDFSNRLIEEGYFSNLNRSLRKMNSPFVLGTYLSIIFLTIVISFFASVILLIFLLFFNLSILFPFISSAKEAVIFRFIKYFWIIFAIPAGIGFFMYYYPTSEGKNIGKKIDQELPFVVIHMAAIATSGIEPMSIFKIILKSGEYKYTSTEFRKLVNLVNFHGKDLVTALRIASRSCSSSRLKELLDGLATTITSGGSLIDFLNKHSETLLFDYRLERERYTKTAETLMDIYISIVIAAPMILLMLFVIMGSTGTLTGFLGLSVSAINLLIIMMIVILNIGFLVFLNLKQPTF